MNSVNPSITGQTPQFSAPEGTEDKPVMEPVAVGASSVISPNDNQTKSLKLTNIIKDINSYVKELDQALIVGGIARRAVVALVAVAGIAVSIAAMVLGGPQGVWAGSALLFVTLAFLKCEISKDPDFKQFNLFCATMERKLIQHAASLKSKLDRHTASLESKQAEMFHEFEGEVRKIAKSVVEKYEAIKHNLQKNKGEDDMIELEELKTGATSFLDFPNQTV